MTRNLARTVSIIGHPTIVLPLAVLTLTLQRGHGAQAAWMVAGFVVFAALLMAYSKWQVHGGRWRHVDASAVVEREALNRFLLIALGVAAALALVVGAPTELALGLSLAAAIVLLALRTQAHFKLSLHMAFVVYAVVLLGSASSMALATGLGFAGLVAWSRLSLHRHVPRDLVAGAVAGCVAGLLFHAAAWTWTG